MGIVDKTPQSTHRQERKYRRFDLRYPVHLKFHSGTATGELDAVSRNVSIGGLLLETDAVIPHGGPVRFVMKVQAGPVARPIELQGEGQVVRVEPAGHNAGFMIAVECKYPMVQVSDHYFRAG